MLYLLIKALVSGAIVAAVSEVAKRTRHLPRSSSRSRSLPPSVHMVLPGGGDTERIAKLSQSTFCFILTSLPMFLVLSVLRDGMGFWAALGLCCLMTVILYFAMSSALARFGISL